MFLKDTGRWSVGGDGYFDILSFTRSDGTSASKLMCIQLSPFIKDTTSLSVLSPFYIKVFLF